MHVLMEPEEVGVRTLRRIARVSEQARPGPPLAAQALEWRIADRTPRSAMCVCHVSRVTEQNEINVKPDH